MARSISTPGITCICGSLYRSPRAGRHTAAVAKVIADRHPPTTHPADHQALQQRGSSRGGLLRRSTPCAWALSLNSLRLTSYCWTVQLPMPGLIRSAQRGGAGQQPVSRLLPVRATGHSRAGRDAPARHHGETIMIAMSLGRIRAGQRERLQSLDQPA